MNDDVELLIDKDGTKYYVLKNSNLDLPDKNTIVYNDGRTCLHNKTYYQGKLIHRENGPAVEYINGGKVWYKNGLIHRENGPAVEQPNGNKIWWINGDIHREGSPAIEHANGDRSWYQYGLPHREDGPAIEYINGYRAYWLNGMKISKEKFYLEKELKNTLINNNIRKRNKI